jgi:hypothetical protein
MNTTSKNVFIQIDATQPIGQIEKHSKYAGFRA